MRISDWSSDVCSSDLAKAMDAVILVVDLAGFTAASDAVPGERLVDLLDRHFEAMVPPVTAKGGEILAFLGDGFLAAFELDSDPGKACAAALDAAIAAVEGVAAPIGRASCRERVCQYV